MKIPVQIATFLMGIACAYSVFAQDFTSPVRYFEYLNNQHSVIVNKNMEYIQYAVHSDDWTTVEQKRVDLITQIKSTKESLKAFPAYKEDSAMRDELGAVLEKYQESFEIEFNAVNLLKRDSKESYEAMEKYLDAQDAAEKKIAEAADRFRAAQETFAKGNNILLVENEQNGEIDQLNALNAYQRAVFLKYFKVSKTNANFNDAMDKRLVDSMEMHRKILLEDSQHSLKILQLMPDFKGDVEYRDAAVQIVQFYTDLAENGYATMVDVLNKDRLTQEDVDAYNAVIGLYNNKIPELIGNFNKATENLLRKNIPKPAVSVKRI